MPHPELIFFFLAIAFVYASVGFGGGSSYLALMALYAIPVPEMRLTALVCNIIVVTGGTLIFIKRGELNYKKILPLVVTSVPMAFVGARLRISEDTFFTILGLSLLLAGSLLWMSPRGGIPAKAEQKPNYLREVLLGAGIGFLSGMVGIGGGIFLSPVLNLTKWDTPKRIAATASVFILINSLAGIAGQLSTVTAGIDPMFAGILAAAVLVGGQLGSRIGANRFSQVAVRRVTGILVFAAGVEILAKHLHF